MNFLNINECVKYGHHYTLLVSLKRQVIQWDARIEERRIKQKDAVFQRLFFAAASEYTTEAGKYIESGKSGTRSNIILTSNVSYNGCDV